MVYRTVSKSDAATPEAAAQFILDDTGGVVQYASAWPIIEEADHWRVPCFSSDGRASMPFPVGAVFPKDNCASNSEIDRQIHQFDLKERPQFESAGGDGPGWTLGIATGDDFTKR